MMVIKYITIFSVFFIVSLQLQAPEPSQKPLESSSYEEMLQTMASEIGVEVKNKINRQICTWTGICLVFITYFSVMALVNMHVQKETRFHTNLELLEQHQQ